jgi:hypothetical protein
LLIFFHSYTGELVFECKNFHVFIQSTFCHFWSFRKSFNADKSIRPYTIANYGINTLKKYAFPR